MFSQVVIYCGIDTFLRDDMLFKIGTRGSMLALAQTELVCKTLEKLGHETEIVIIKTTGDKNQKTPLSDIGGKALFAKELQQALLDDTIDLAVHSLKDLETKHPKGLSLLAVLEREDSRDIIVTKKGLLIDFLDKGMPFVLGTCSPRRAAFSKNLWPNVEIVPLRGNVDSRLQKVIHGELDATILAMAGLKRLGLFEKIKEQVDVKILDPSIFVPASCQGIIGIEGKEKFKDVLHPLVCQKTFLSAQREREQIEEFGGNCHSAIGVHTSYIDDQIKMQIQYLDEDTKNIVYKESMMDN